MGSEREFVHILSADIKVTSDILSSPALIANCQYASNCTDKVARLTIGMTQSLASWCAMISSLKPLNFVFMLRTKCQYCGGFYIFFRKSIYVADRCSKPIARPISISPLRIWLATLDTAIKPEEQNRLTVCHVVVFAIDGFPFTKFSSQT